MTNRAFCISLALPAVLLLLLAPGIAQSACASPTANAGSINWNGTAMQVCDGTSWSALGGGGALSALSDVTLTSPSNGHVLQYNGTDWINTAASSAMTTTTMVANWPDALRCSNMLGLGANAYGTLYLSETGRTDSPYATLYRVDINGAGYWINFNSDGTYQSNGNMSGSNCLTSITANSSAGRAFNFIGTGAVTTFNVGTASAPGLAVTSDTDTGIYQASANTLSLTAGGVEVLRANTATSGVNYLNATAAATTTTPILAAAGSDTNIGLDLNAKGTGTVRVTAQTAAAVGLTVKAAASQTGDLLQVQNSSGTAQTVINASGNVGIGTTNPTTNLVIVNDNESTTLSTRTQGLTNAGLLIQGEYTAGAYSSGLFWSSIVAGKPHAGVWTRTDGGGSYLFLGTSNNYATGITFGAYLDALGNLTQTWNASDLRLKADIQDAPTSLGLESVMQLRPVQYKWKDKTRGADLDIGFIAQEVERVLPQMVSEGPNSDLAADLKTIKTLRYEKLVVPLVKAIQELKAENDNLRIHVDKLASRLDSHMALHRQSAYRHEAAPEPGSRRPFEPGM